MKKKFKNTNYRLLVLLLLGVGAIAYLFLGAPQMGVLNPKGLVAIKEKSLILTASYLMLIVVVPVFIFTVVFAWRYREGNRKAKYTPDWEHSHIAEIFWWGIPFIIIAILGVITWKSTHALNPFKPLETDKKPVVIHVVALQWKWLFMYPEQKIATLNFIQFPEQVPINFEITSDAPMNSFWIPELGGQIYAMPAMRTKLHLMAQDKGVFRGCSANLSGEGFAGMTFTAQATSQADFEAWVDSVKQSPNALNLETYNQLVAPSAYDPVATYSLAQEDLFEHILMKYMEK